MPNAASGSCGSGRLGSRRRLCASGAVSCGIGGVNAPPSQCALGRGGGEPLGCSDRSRPETASLPTPSVRVGRRGGRRPSGPGSPLLTESMGRAWWCVAAQDRNQQRKQLLNLDLAAKLLRGFLRSPGVRQREILASSVGLLSRYTLGSALSWMRWMRGCGSAGTTLSSDALWWGWCSYL